jgi:hypothetical protein
MTFSNNAIFVAKSHLAKKKNKKERKKKERKKERKRNCTCFNDNNVFAEVV